MTCDNVFIITLLKKKAIYSLHHQKEFKKGLQEDTVIIVSSPGIFIGNLLIYHDSIQLGWPKTSFGLFDKMVQENPNELFGQSNNILLNYLIVTRR